MTYDDALSPFSTNKVIAQEGAEQWSTCKSAPFPLARPSTAAVRARCTERALAGLPKGLAAGDDTDGSPTLAASNAWANALTIDAADRKAFKGLLKVADQILQSGSPLDRAIRIYDFLLQAAPGSPFADHARAQAEIARRKAAKG